jgi:hypothetical protein
MRAHKLKKSPEEAKRDALAVVEEIRSLRLTEEEEKILEDFEEFQKKSAFLLLSSTEITQKRGEDDGQNGD